MVIPVDVLKFTGLSCLLAQCWQHRAKREREMKGLKRKCRLRLNKFSRMQSETNFAFCIEHSVPRVRKAEFWPVCLYFLYSQSVYKCDFLNLQLQQPLQLAGDAVEAFLRQLHNPIDSLPAQLFHVVVFSLLLSYFPSPYQRWICCKKAHELLELHGLLLIITPDSSHQNRHALMMRSWRVAVESLGFKRYKYVKYSHMHLIAFRKVCLATTSDLVSRNYPEMLYIPQDFNSNEEEDCADVPMQGRSEFEDDQLAWGFTELPDTPYDSDSGESQGSSVPGFHELEDPILLQS